MPVYPLNNLGPVEFERLSQSLLKEIIGDGTTTFGAGADGAREATFEGRASYPSQLEQWDGNWIFQAKFHDTELIGIDSARQAIIREVDEELSKITQKYAHPCDNFILMTNVPLSSTANRGTHDRIMKDVAPKYADYVKNVRVWGADEISRFLEKYPSVRQSYMQFLTTGDLIQELLTHVSSPTSELAETIRLYLASSFRNEQHAQLVQAGDTGDERILLQKVFIDLDVTVENWKTLAATVRLLESGGSTLTRRYADRRTSALRILLSDAKSVVLIGGPGQGKSTLGQYLAQLHRATILAEHSLDRDNPEDLTPLIARIPFRVLLKEYAQWITQAGTMDNLEIYLAEKIRERSARDITVSQVHQVFKSNPCLLIFDGLDEVMDQNLRNRMVDRITDFLGGCEEVFGADVQVVATSRPVGYSNQFDPNRFTHLTLANISKSKAKK